jgi:hypothetical protein
MWMTDWLIRNKHRTSNIPDKKSQKLEKISNHNNPTEIVRQFGIIKHTTSLHSERYQR